MPLPRTSARFAVLAASVLAAVPAGAQTPTFDASYNEPAVFRVTTDVVNADLRPFTATIGAFGNSLVRNGGAFEPVMYRNSVNAQADAPDRIVGNARSLSQYDTLREGFMDGASVRVYRVENGRFRIVREDRVARHHASDWHVSTENATLIPPDTTAYTWRWAEYNRPDVPYYFALVAVDSQGNESAKSGAVSARRPNAVTPKAAKEANATRAFREPKAPAVRPAPPTPANLRAELRADGSLQLTWDAVKAADLAGYRLYRSDYPPESHGGFALELAGRATSPEQQIRADDRCFVSKTFYSYSRREHVSNRVWDAKQGNREALPALVDFYPDEDPAKSWELVRHGADTPVTDSGETFLRLRLAEGASESLSLYNHAGTDQDWYEVLETVPYTVSVWLRQEGAKAGTVTFEVGGYYADKIAPATFSPTAEWRQYTHTFTPPDIQPGRQPNQMRLVLKGAGTIDVDNYRIYRADTPYLDFTERQCQRLAESGMESLRTHGPVKSGTVSYSMEQFTNDGGAIHGVGRGNTLPQMLRVMRRTRMIPWLQIEMHMSPAEWQGFVEYMAAPFDPATDTPEGKPWAAKRHRQGQTRPWTDEFAEIRFELSNETWNGLFRPWVFDGMIDATTGEEYARGEVYGLFQEHVRDALKASPYWTEALDRKFVFVLGGWARQSYGREAASRSPNSRWLTIAAYNGGWDEGEGPPRLTPASYFSVLAQVSQTALPRAKLHLAELLELKANRGTPLDLGVYEAGPGYALDGLNKAKVTPEQAQEQELVMKSLAAGTATLDSFLTRACYGFVSQNFFTFNEGQRWSSHAKWYRGGQAYPSWMTLALFNREALGDLLRTETLKAPTVDLPAFRRREATTDAPLAAVYATRKGDRVAVVVVSRKIAGYPKAGDDGFTPTTLELPFQRAARITLHRMVGDPTAQNYDGENVRIERIDLPADRFAPRFVLDADRGADARGLPPAATLLYVFEGTDMPAGRALDPREILKP